MTLIVLPELHTHSFDYLCLAPYYQFRYATSKDLPCVPLITEETTNFVNNPRAKNMNW